MFGNVGPWELILILLIALIVFGPGKLPQAGRAIGEAIREFKKASAGLKANTDTVKTLVAETQKEAGNTTVETQENIPNTAVQTRESTTAGSPTP